MPRTGQRLLQEDYFIEWSADCNGDGIVDYGQIQDGTFADTDGNGVPDCCDAGEACSQDAVQWRIEDGGNGHWYRYVDRTTTDFTWSETRAEAMSMGGDLVTLETIDEWDFFCQVTNCGPEGVNSGPIGLVRSESDPNQWSWVSGVDLTYDRWRHPDEPNPNPSENRGIIIPSWPQSPYNAFATNSQRLLQEDYFIEWSADCNGDGIVDYGQIQDGTFADTDGNGVPDVCEVCLGDITGNGVVDAADLGILLAVWNTDGKSAPEADINGDGTVNAADLGILLGAWGECP